MKNVCIFTELLKGIFLYKRFNWLIHNYIEHSIIRRKDMRDLHMKTKYNERNWVQYVKTYQSFIISLFDCTVSHLIFLLQGKMRVDNATSVMITLQTLYLRLDGCNYNNYTNDKNNVKDVTLDVVHRIPSGVPWSSLNLHADCS